MNLTEADLSVVLGYRVTRAFRVVPGAWPGLADTSVTVFHLEAEGKRGLMLVVLDECASFWTPLAVFDPKFVFEDHALNAIDLLAALA